MPRLCTFALLLLVTTGCDRSPPAPMRGKLAGQVSLNGKLLPEGKIRFMALDPNGLNVLATVKDGHYSVSANEGPTKGKYRVEFSVLSATKQRIPNDDAPGEFIDINPETLPPRYHRSSDITIDYDPENPQPHDFQLKAP